MLPSEPGSSRVGKGRRRWTLLTPTVLWPVVILAMAPSFYGFAGGPGGLPSVASIGSRSSGGVAAADLPGSSGVIKGQGRGVSSGGGAKRSPFAAFKERVRDGKRRVKMQVCSGGDEFGCGEAQNVTHLHTWSRRTLSDVL